ncbi:MAG: serine acetyltransferase [Bacteroidota bacterium]
MTPQFFRKISDAHNQPKTLPGEEEIDDFIVKLLQFLFPELNRVRLVHEDNIRDQYRGIQLDFEQLLEKTKACRQEGLESICQSFFRQLEGVYDECLEDAEAILNGDPAAYDLKEVIRTYPGFFAIAIYRIAHVMLQLDIPYLPRIFTEYAHARTGIDIHPGARIGHRFCIDHGTGVVIGETTIIGHDVKIYQGVTLGALSVDKQLAKVKRHPTIEDNVVIYSGATILGGETVIGQNSIIGGNVWLTKSVGPNSRVYYQSQDQQTIKAANF